VSCKTRILILGGGLAGLEVARILEKLLEPKEAEIRLASRDNVVLFTPMLHEIATSDLDLTAIVLDLTFSKDTVQFMSLRAHGHSISAKHSSGNSASSVIASSSQVV
jgi:NADH dehydrogenase FAD-containing subunit